MTTTIPSTDLVVSVEPLFTADERIALAGFLAGYSGLTRDAYALDRRMYTAWCQQHDLHLFQARRADIECFGRDLEARGGLDRRSPAGCARSPGSTARPSRRSCSSTRLLCTCAARGWTTSPTRSGWTVTGAVRCWWRPVLAPRTSTR